MVKLCVAGSNTAGAQCCSSPQPPLLYGCCTAKEARTTHHVTPHLLWKRIKGQVILCPFGRAVRSSKTTRMGATLLLPRYTAFLRLHRICSLPISNQLQFLWEIMFHSVRSNALSWGVRHTLRRASSVWSYVVHRYASLSLNALQILHKLTYV